MSEFLLDERLRADCMPVCELDLCRVLLMNDNRWPWAILVPRIVNAEEIHLLDTNAQTRLLGETTRIAEVMAAVTGCEKINIGALGNIVRQLHVHVIARNCGDENWPGPVWGYGTRQPYPSDKGKLLLNKIKRQLA